ncbi:MAG TPA: M28 family metallopeptidase [Gemmatimonadaceae bacterium]|nr:M28 family metallopeptidase [Gemmatimonadaceae bacterium]
MTRTLAVRCVSAMLVLATVSAAACAPGDGSAGDSAALAPALAAITADGILGQINVLAADDFEGRAPGTPGEDKTVEFLVNRFKELGLAPGNPDGTYIQNVSLIGFRTTPTLSMATAAGTQSFAFPEDFVAVSRRNAATINVDASDVVFVGYGVVAPEYGWDDYKDVDVRGKTIVMLVNDPPVPLTDDSAQLDSTMFKGRAMTYYGRWTYKYEIASEKGAAAAIIVHETGPAGYPYDVVVGSWGQENFDVKTPGDNAGRVGVEAWMTLDKTRELFASAGQNFDSLKATAVSKDFRPVALDAKATFHLKNAVREIQSRNVIAKLEGADSVLRDEYVIYTAHWDHLGRDSTLDGDQIYNGALDNASGTSAMLEIAEAFTKLPEPPARSILFLAVTAEEKGLLGAKYYAENPLYPLNRTLADINMDGVNQWGRTRDLTVVGLGNSTLDDVLASVVAPHDRVIKPDAEPEKGFFYRSDHFEFAKKGVPALYIDAGTDFIDKPAGYGQEKRDEYTNNDYHKPSDEVKPDWDLSGAVEDAQALFQVGWRVAQGDRFPEWKAGTEFKAIREASLPAGDR